MWRRLRHRVGVWLTLPTVLICACGEEPTEPPPTPPPPPTVASVVVTPANVSATSLGETAQLSASARQSDGTAISGRTFSWVSSNNSVATVNSTGLVTARGAGSTNITATTANVSGSASVSVQQVLVSVAVTPENHTLTSLGETVQATAQALDANDSAIPGHTFTWATSDVAVISVNAAGVLTAIADGTATITATTNGVSGSTEIVVQQTVAVVEMMSTADTLIVIGDTSVFSASATDARSNPMGGQAWTWTSSQETVATVDTLGNVTAVGAGLTSISATTGGISSSRTLVVIPTPVARLSMPDSGDVAGQVAADLMLLTNGTGLPTGAAAITVTWDPSVLQFNASSNPTFYSSGVSNNTAGSLSVAVSEPVGIAGNLLVAAITFDVIGASGSMTSITVAVDRLISPTTFADFTASAVGEHHTFTVR